MIVREQWIVPVLMTAVLAGCAGGQVSGDGGLESNVEPPNDTGAIIGDVSAPRERARITPPARARKFRMAAGGMLIIGGLLWCAARPWSCVLQTCCCPPQPGVALVVVVGLGFC